MPSPISPLGPPAEGVMLSQPSTRLFVDSTPYGAGTLVLANSRISWRSDAAGSQFSIEYKGVSIHAVSRDTSKFPHHCLYLMVDGKVDEDVARCVPEAEEASPMDADEEEEEEEDDGDDDPVTEIRFVPADVEQLDNMFAVMSDCQQLHPDSDEENLSDDGLGEEEGEEEEEEEAADLMMPNGHGGAEEDAAAEDCPTEAEMTPQGLATLRRLEGLLGGGAGGGADEAPSTEGGANAAAAQFEDADDMES